jgi:hypothetical protein
MSVIDAATARTRLAERNFDMTTSFQRESREEAGRGW